MTLHISSTSFLLPGNRQWAALSAVDDLRFGEYGDWFSALALNNADNLLCMLFLGELIQDASAPVEGIDDFLKELLAPLRMRLSRSGLPVIVAFSSWRPASPIANARQPSRWNKIANAFELSLYKLAENNPALYLIDMDTVWSRNGMSAAFDERNRYAARCPLSSRGIEQLASSAASVLGRIRRSAKKVLVLDCDNTLWGGVVGEVGIEGLQLGSDGTGQAFVDFQRVAKALQQEGVLLAISSKNNEAEARAVFERHPGMVLKWDDLVAAKVNWSEKADNVAAIAEELDLGLSSFVFWDDNPLEREKMRLLQPDVTTPELPVDVGLWPAQLLADDLFARFEITSDDKRKGEQYRSRAAFIQARDKVTDHGSFLKSIVMRPEALPIDQASIGRAEQLCQKTNQFNLRTVRHSAADLASLARDNPDTAFLVRLSDRFGDHGIVGLAIARQVGEIGFVDSFMMSCRVLGRHLEAWMMSQLVAVFKRRGIKWLLAEFVPSGRNSVAEGFLASYGFTQLRADDDPSSGQLTSVSESQGLGGITYVLNTETSLAPFEDAFSRDGL